MLLYDQLTSLVQEIGEVDIIIYNSPNDFTSHLFKWIYQKKNPERGITTIYFTGPANDAYDYVDERADFIFCVSRETFDVKNVMQTFQTSNIYTIKTVPHGSVFLDDFPELFENHGGPIKTVSLDETSLALEDSVSVPWNGEIKPYYETRKRLMDDDDSLYFINY